MSEKYNNAVGPQVREVQSGPGKLIPILAALTMGGAVAGATQYFAHTFQYHPSLGTHVHGIYPPWSILTWASKWYAVYPHAFTKVGGLGATAGSDVARNHRLQSPTRPDDRRSGRPRRIRRGIPGLPRAAR